VVLTMPRTLARLPYGSNTKPIDEFDFEEVELGPDKKPKTVEHKDYCWMSTAYVMGARLTEAFAKYGWCTSIRGAEGGGRVDNLPTHVVTGEDGDTEVKCPTEVLIPDRREAEISACGFLPLCNYKDKDYSVFFGGQTTQKPKKYEGKGGDDATANAALSARLPYILATSRIAHYLKVMARDRVGAFMERDECEQWLNNWIMNYVTASNKPSAEEKATHPLADAKIMVSEVPGQPGSYSAVALLRPWLQFEELTTSMRLVAKLKQGT
jgi:type VI secretion system protein ImpC